MTRNSIHTAPRVLSALLLVAAPAALASRVAADTEEDKLVAADGASGDQFGRSLALSGDRAVLSAYGDDDNGSFSGSAYVFHWDGTEWDQEDKLEAADGASADLFGNSVSISGDTVLVGAPLDDDNGNLSGSAYVFVRVGSNWVQQAKLHANDGAAGDNFGFAVALDGDYAVVGAHENDDGGSGAGSAYVFKRNGSSWSQQAELNASDASSGDSFGYAVAISGDTVAVGSYADDDNGLNSGSVYVFKRNGSSWTQQDKVKPTDGAPNDFFGNSVSLSGTSLLVGAPEDDDSGSATGAGYVFLRSGSSWSQQAKLVPTGGEASHYVGYSVSLHGDLAVLSSHGDDPSGALSGSAVTFHRSGSSWSEGERLLASDGDQLDYMSYSVAAGDGHALVGAYGDDDSGSDSGSAYAYELESVGPVEPGQAYCFGDGSGASCPCGRRGAAGHGCPNTNTNGNGARLSGVGTASFGDDSFALTVSDGAPSRPGIVIQGGSAVAYPDGNPSVANSSGILCVNPALRGDVFFTNSNGSATVRDFHGEDFGLSAVAGGPTYYQYWYRDASNSCQNGPGNAAAFNFSNGYQVSWTP